MGKIKRAIKFLAANDSLTSEAAEGLLRAMAYDAPEFREEDHPRDEDGRFTSGGGSSSSSTQNKISAKMDDGILEIVLPKYREEEKKEKTNLIEIQ